MSENRLTSSLMLALLSLIGVGFLTPPAYASSEIRDHTDQDRIRVEFSHHSRSSSGTVTRSRQPSQSNQVRETPSISPDMPGSFSKTSQQSGAESQGPVRSTVCFRGDGDTLTRMHGTYRCNIPEPEESENPPAAEAAMARPAAEEPPVAEPVEIVITASDLLELIPSTPQILMDRGPFGLKNAHTNFYTSDHRAQTISQTMFGQQVSITATPVEFRWDYGDGNTLTTQSPGHPVEVFNTETETSHRYPEPGEYTVTLTTVFEGSYQVDGGPTQAVSSPVTQQADPVEIEIWRAVTRNVDQTCSENPDAWGC